MSSLRDEFDARAEKILPVQARRAGMIKTLQTGELMNSEGVK
jgi:hypothetical protein